MLGESVKAGNHKTEKKQQKRNGENARCKEQYENVFFARHQYSLYHRSIDAISILFINQSIPTNNIIIKIYARIVVLV